MKKICNKCEVLKEATLENFGPDRRNKSGLQGQCRECGWADSQKWRDTHGEDVLNYREKHRGTIRCRLHKLYSDMQKRCSKYPSYLAMGIKNNFKKL